MFHFSIYAHVPTVFFPVLWFEKRTIFSPEIVVDLRLLLMLPVIELYRSLGVGLLGIVILALQFVPRILSRDNWKLLRRNKR
jgi:hypothetical protein